jgi:hypothetical protein
MSKYNWAELLNKWKREELTVEQAIGQLLLWTEELLKRLKGVESSVVKLKREKAAQGEALLSQGARPIEEQLEIDALKREQTELRERVDRIAQRVEGLVMRETRRYGA